MITKDKDGVNKPPPPPPRVRGGSKGSIDGSGALARKPSNDANRIVGSSLVKEPVAEDVPAEPGKGVDILADLDALQREVEALMGKYEKPGTEK
jgi:hypothetical protein